MGQCHVGDNITLTSSALSCSSERRCFDIFSHRLVSQDIEVLLVLGGLLQLPELRVQARPCVPFFQVLLKTHVAG